MRILVASPIGSTRRQFENWLGERGHKVLAADTFERCVKLLGSNSDIELVISEWELGAYTSYDVYLKAGQVTRITDADEVQQSLRFIILITPGMRSNRHIEQLEVLRSLPQFTILEKPINRALFFASLDSASAAESAVTVAPQPTEPEAALHVDEPSEIQLAALPAHLGASACEILDSLHEVLSAAQQNHDRLRQLLTRELISP